MKLTMVIRELTMHASLDVLARVHLGRLACARANQPYIIPIFFAYQDHSLYCVSTIGQKVEWMRENPLVALEVDEIDNPQQWRSVIVSGRYEEFSDTPQMRDQRQLAWSLLQKHELWWEPGLATANIAGTERSMTPVYFRIRIGRITGHYATHL